MTSEGYTLVRIAGEQAAEVWPLPVDRPVVLGRRDPERGAPDIDLEPDRRVSRAHARIWHERGGWWIADLGSRRGTLVAGDTVSGDGPTRLHPWAEIILGETTLMLAPPGWRRLRGGGLVLDLEIASAVSLALASLGRPVVSRLVVRNPSARTAHPGGRLTLALGGFAAPATVDVPPLVPLTSATLPPPSLALDRLALERQAESGECPLNVVLDGQPLAGEAGCRVLAYNAWLHAPEDRLSLAAFVQPNHPLVAQLALDVLRAERGAEPVALLRALYEHLSDDWQLEYQLEPPHWDQGSQRIRLPHEILVRSDRREGQGTCLDLAVLFAAGLEHLGAQPLIAVVTLGSWWHALVGVRVQPAAGLEPLLSDAGRLVQGVAWVDPTGCTRDPSSRLTWDAAAEAASACLADHPLVFALDVAAARLEGVTPLPFTGTPPWSSLADAAVAAAVWHAAITSGPLGTVALLCGLLAVDGGTRRMVERVLGSADGLAERLASQRPDGVVGQPTPSHRLVLAMAESQAREDGSPWVLERHLLHALLGVSSPSLDRALVHLGLSRAALVQALRATEPGDAPPPPVSVFNETGGV